ncbi:hypothetical protein BGX33_004565 [Mortierella sp. NVP41]|nr:hypothetical protein BGX33_004565 [Mortierella sp. NVP41]
MLASPSGLVINTCNRDQAIDTFYTWAHSEHWNPSHKGLDIEVCHNADPKGFFYGTVDPSSSLPNNNNNDNNDDKPQPAKDEIVSVISAVRYGDDQGWIGWYIADSKYRGRGYGLATFNNALEHLNHSTRESIGLDGVLAQVHNYKKSGFTQSSWCNERRHGPIQQLIETQERELADRIAKDQVEGLVLLSDPRVDIEQLPGIEVRSVGLKRPQFVKHWAHFHADHPEKHRVGVAFVSPDKKDEKTGKPLILGYACVRPAVSSYRVGPLYAADTEIAKRLLVKLAYEVVQAEKQSPLGVPLNFDIDVPDQNLAAIEYFNGLGWNNTFSCLRMWKGKVPPSNVDTVYGVTTLEVG